MTTLLGASPATDVVVIGGGVIGLTVALEVRRRGLSVLVVDPEPGHAASWAAAGMLAPVTEAHYGEEDLVRLTLAAAARWPGFAAALEAESGRSVGYRPCGTVVVGVDASDRAAIDELLAFQAKLGLHAERLSASACRTAVPALAPGVRGGATAPDDHQVDNRLLVAALLAAAEVLGVGLEADSASEVVVSANRVVGVRLASGRALSCGAAVLAAGCHSAQMGGLPPGVAPPVRPVKGHILRLRGDGGRPALERTVRGLVHGRSVYLVPRLDGSLVVGATVEEMGFDTTVRAGVVYELLRDAQAVVPGVAELELTEASTGLRPGTPDNAPFVGWTAVENLAVATGHYRNGVLLAPLTAEAIASILTGDPPPVELAAFAVDRFSGAGPRPTLGPLDRPDRGGSGR